MDGVKKVDTEEGSSALNVTTMEEPSSVRSRGRSSSARIHGKKLFRCCNLQLQKNLLQQEEPSFMAFGEDVLPWMLKQA